MSGLRQRRAGFEPQDAISFDAGDVFEMPQQQAADAKAPCLLVDIERLDLAISGPAAQGDTAAQPAALLCRKKCHVGTAKRIDIEAEIVHGSEQPVHQRAALDYQCACASASRGSAMRIDTDIGLSLAENCAILAISDAKASMYPRNILWIRRMTKPDAAQTR